MALAVQKHPTGAFRPNKVVAVVHGATSGRSHFLVSDEVKFAISLRNSLHYATSYITLSAMNQYGRDCSDRLGPEQVDLDSSSAMGILRHCSLCTDACALLKPLACCCV